VGDAAGELPTACIFWLCANGSSSGELLGRLQRIDDGRVLALVGLRIGLTKKRTLRSGCSARPASTAGISLCLAIAALIAAASRRGRLLHQFRQRAPRRAFPPEEHHEARCERDPVLDGPLRRSPSACC